MEDFRTVCGQSAWKRRRREDIQNLCADALADARLNRKADCLRFLQYRVPPPCAPSPFTRCRTQMVRTLSEAITGDRQRCSSNPPTKKLRLAESRSLGEDITVSKDQFVSHVERLLPRWRQSWVDDTRRNDFYSICTASATSHRREAPTALHIYCPHGGERDHLPFCVQKLWSNIEAMCFDVVVPDVLLSDRLHQWSRSRLKCVRVAKASDATRSRPPYNNAYACTRIWAASLFASLREPQLALYSIVVADDLEWWPPQAKLTLGRVHARAIVVGCSLQIWKRQRHLKSVTPYVSMHSANSLYICYLPQKASTRAILDDGGSRLYKSSGTSPLVITLQMARAYVMWLAILSDNLMEAVFFGYILDMRTAWRSFGIACNATSRALAGSSLPPGLLSHVQEVRRWSVRAFLSQLSAAQKGVPLRRARRNILAATENADMNLAHICSACLAPLGRDELSQKAHACDWDGLQSVHIPEVEEAGAVTVAGFFVDYEDHAAPMHCIRLIIRERNCIDQCCTGVQTHENANVGDELLRSWYRALLSENLHHKFDSSSMGSLTSTLSKRGAVLTIMGNQNFRDCCPSARHDFRQFWEEEAHARPGISVRSKAPVDLMQDNQTVRILTAHIAASARATDVWSQSTPQLTLAALSCISQHLPLLLGTDWRLVGSSAAMFHRWNFYADVQLVNLLPSFFLARNSCSRLHQLAARRLLPNIRWCAPVGSPAHLALELIVPS